MNKLALSAVLLICFAFSAKAGILVDPYIGFGTQKSTLDATSSNFDEDTQTAKFLGSRLGYSYLLFSAGIDYQVLEDEDLSQKNISLFVGVDLPILLRAWAEYFVDSSFDHDLIDEVDFKDGYSLGLGFTALPFVSLNLEAQFLNYDMSLKSQPSNKFEASSAAYILSVSLPLDL